MDLLYPLAGAILLIGIPIYLYAVARLQRIIKAEWPDWIAARRSESIFYASMPNAVDPSINLAVVRLALGSGWRSLTSPQAKGHVWRIRLMLPSLSAVFVGVLVAIPLGAP